HVFNVPPTAFTPIPKVDSAIIRLTPHSELPFVVNDEQRLQKIVTQAFSQRRKTLHNCLKDFITAAQWQQLGINPQLRPEQLSVAEYVRIANI
ncbi:MAG: 16S rRNA (adenine(1518)-N(6)/adenine(1519)-N(6))-dimethyltransferase, partial [Gammaproteobacteria bacterium]|nr:16S rRNA (adenine(1518)-N(6)/adenine(1519)-N(6))-dimethyltransferase [Gammaproteobacteria bacterium]